MAYISVYKGVDVDTLLGVIKPGGNTGQVLAKLSTTDYDVNWVDINPNFISFTPVVATAVPNNSLFVNSADNKLSFKDSIGTVYVVSMA